MRRLLVVVGVLVALVVVATALVVANLNRIVEGNRDRILAEISAGFGRPVSIARIAVGFHGGLAITLDDVRVDDDPAFAREPFLVATQAHAVVAFWPLLSRRVHVRRVVVNAPAITLIRTTHGMNVDSLGRRPGADPAPGAPTGAAAPSQPAPVSAIAVGLLNLEHANVRFVDRTGPKAVERLIDPLDVRVSDLSLTTPMTIEVSATLVGDPAGTLHVHGTVGPVGDPPFAADVPIAQTVTVRSPALEVERMQVTGTMRRDADGRPVATVGVSAPAATAAGVALSAMDLTVVERQGVATLQRLAFTVFGGTVQGKGRVDHTGEAPTFAFDTSVRGVDVEQALAAQGGDRAVHLVGRLDADTSLTGTGGDPATVRHTLAGRGHAEVHDGAIRGLNVADGVLTGTTGLAGLTTLVPLRVRERHPDIFATGDTRFQTLTADFRMANEKLHLDSAVATAKDYDVRSHGSVTFAQYVDVTGTLHASPGLTADIVGAIKEARFLTDEASMLAIPFRMAGQLPNVRPQVDTEFVGRALKKALVDEGLDRLLDGAKTGSKDSGKGSTRDLLRRGLGQLFGR